MVPGTSLSMIPVRASPEIGARSRHQVPHEVHRARAMPLYLWHRAARRGAGKKTNYKTRGMVWD